MSTVIQVLEQMGSDANLQNDQAIEQLLLATEVDAEQAKAINNKDVISLERQLDVCPDVVCFLVPAEDDEKSEDDSSESDGSKENEASIKSIVNG